MAKEAEDSDSSDEQKSEGPRTPSPGVDFDTDILPVTGAWGALANADSVSAVGIKGVLGDFEELLGDGLVMGKSSSPTRSMSY